MTMILLRPLTNSGVNLSNISIIIDSKQFLHLNRFDFIYMSHRYLIGYGNVKSHLKMPLLKSYYVFVSWAS